MSNQVYANETDKYRPQNGLNLYAVVPNGIGYNTPQTMAWTPQTVQTNGVIELQSGNTRFTALRAGVYNFTFSFTVVDHGVPGSVNTEPLIDIIYTNLIIGDNTLQEYHQLQIAGGGSSANFQRTTPMSCSVFMNIGDSVRVTINNLFAIGSTLDLLYSTCNIIAT